MLFRSEIEIAVELSEHITQFLSLSYLEEETKTILNSCYEPGLRLAQRSNGPLLTSHYQLLHTDWKVLGFKPVAPSAQAFFRPCLGLTNG